MKIVFNSVEDDHQRWAAVVARDRSADGRFVYSVRTTGIYCRPSCAARRPKRQNVTFHDNPAAAECGGFRPCKRCRPEVAVTDEARIVIWACRSIETAERTLSLSALAADAKLSPSHFHRLFKAATGMTPRAYGAACRGERARAELHSGASVTESIYAAGYASSGRFYEDVPNSLGMTPTAFRAGGAGEAIRFAVGACTLGAVLVAATDKGVCAIFLGDDPELLVHELEGRFPNARLRGGDADFEGLVARVAGLVETPARVIDLPLDLRGTHFQLRVWQALRAIPSGQTLSYSELARRIGAPKAVRAVAGACAANAVAVAIPCHRVVRTDGSLSGYRWGVERKRALLARERAS